MITRYPPRHRGGPAVQAKAASSADCSLSVTWQSGGSAVRSLMLIPVLAFSIRFIFDKDQSMALAAWSCVSSLCRRAVRSLVRRSISGLELSLIIGALRCRQLAPICMPVKLMEGKSTARIKLAQAYTASTSNHRGISWIPCVSQVTRVQHLSRQARQTCTQLRTYHQSYVM